MKYLFIILIAFSFIGCDDEDGENNTNPNRIIYATFTILNNADNVCEWSGTCGPIPFFQSSGDFSSPLPSGTTITTDSFVTNYVPYNLSCGAVLTAYTNDGISTYPQNTEWEVKVYVDDQLYETRAFTGLGSCNIIIN